MPKRQRQRQRNLLQRLLRNVAPLNQPKTNPPLPTMARRETINNRWAARRSAEWPHVHGTDDWEDYGILSLNTGTLV